MVLEKCEWGHDDYSLNVQNLPLAPKASVSSPAHGRGKKALQPSLFDTDNSGDDT
ncbi:hypothetical protein CCP3SC15_1660006 [Gammaproteobacteria bacterium]